MASDAHISARKPWEQADLVLYVVDATDFPATFNRQLAATISAKAVLVLSKVDLLPAKVTEAHIIEWVQEYLLGMGVTFQAIHTMSAGNGAHAKSWWTGICKAVPGGTVVIVGARGTGKSTLHRALQDLVANAPVKKKRSRRRGRGKARAAVAPTAPAEEKTSANMPIKDDEGAPGAAAARPKSPTRRRRYVRSRAGAPKAAPGEQPPSEAEAPPPAPPQSQPPQQQLLPQLQAAPASTPASAAPKRTRARRKPAKSLNAPAPKASASPPKAEVAKSEPAAAPKLVDTSGYQAGSNLKDLLCAGCGERLVPKKRLRSRLARLRGGQTIILDDLLALGLASASARTQAVFRLYVPAAITTRRSTEPKLRAHLQQNGFTPDMCPACKDRLRTSGWEELEVELNPGQDLVINGLGWLNVNQQKVGVRLFLPTGAGASLRPQLV